MIASEQKKQDEIVTLPAPDEEGVDSSVPPIPLQSDIRRLATLVREATGGGDDDDDNNAPPKNPTSVQQ